MPTTTIKNLITKGLYQENLLELMELCNSHIEESPLLYFTLLSIFKSLESEYDNQAIIGSRYEEVNSSLQSHILKCLDNPTKPLMENLIKEFWKLNQ